jgi:hypothetical protein
LPAQSRVWYRPQSYYRAAVGEHSGQVEVGAWGGVHLLGSDVGELPERQQVRPGRARPGSPGS